MGQVGIRMTLNQQFLSAHLIRVNVNSLSKNIYYNIKIHPKILRINLAIRVNLKISINKPRTKMHQLQNRNIYGNK